MIKLSIVFFFYAVCFWFEVFSLTLKLYKTKSIAAAIIMTYPIIAVTFGNVPNTINPRAAENITST